MPGESEKILGRLLVDSDRRDAVVIATKAVSRPNSERRFDASRNHLLNSLNGSLRRLGVDHIDLWRLHAWDLLTPSRETLSAVDIAVSLGQGALRGDQQLRRLADVAGRHVAERRTGTHDSGLFADGVLLAAARYRAGRSCRPSRPTGWD